MHRVFAIGGIALLSWAAPARAQVIGTFTWQTQPYCNLVTLTVVQLGGAYQLNGSDNLCGAGLAPVTGTAVVAGGQATLGFAVSLPTGQVAQITGTVTLATGQGAWSDASGHSGTLVPTGTSTGGSVRPGPPVAPSRTQTLTVHGSAMRPASGISTGRVNGCIANNTGTSFSADLPLALPVGASVHAIRLFVYDGSSTAGYYAILTRHIPNDWGFTSQSIGYVTGGSLSHALATHEMLPAPGVSMGAGESLELSFVSSGTYANGVCRIEVTYTQPSS